METDSRLGVLIIGAHPDDPDGSCGGTAALYARLGHRVRLLTLTNGSAGHHIMAGAPVAHRRWAETQAAGKVLGVEYTVLDNPDGSLEPTVEMRNQVISALREFRPDIVIAPRPYDYHPDHRYTGILVQDAVIMAKLSNSVSRWPRLESLPVHLYKSDRFQKPYPFMGDIVIGIDEVVDLKLSALACHESQVFEAMPSWRGILDQVPADPAKRLTWFKDDWMRSHVDRQAADRYRAKLIEFYGEERGRAIQHVEAYEICEYGAPVAPDDLPRLFPFFRSV